MRTVNFTQLRQSLAGELDSVINDAEEVVVTRSGHEPVVIVPLVEYVSMKETEYLVRNPSNAAALRRSIAEFKLVKRINDLIADVMRNGYEGIGKREPLRGELSGFWSRPIDRKHRLVYRVKGDDVEVIACRYHYAAK